MSDVLGTTVLPRILTCTLYHCRIPLRLDPREIGSEYLGLLFSLPVTMPVCWQLYYERRDRFIIYTLPRVSKLDYLAVKWLACAFYIRRPRAATSQ